MSVSYRKILASFILFTARVLWFFESQHFVPIFFGVIFSFVLAFSLVFRSYINSYLLEFKSDVLMVEDYLLLPKNYSDVLEQSNKSFSLAIQRKTFPVARKVSDIEFPVVFAKNILVSDLNSNTILYEKDKLAKVSPASTTKLVTAIVSFKLYKDLNEYIQVPPICTKVDGQKVGLIENNLYKVDDLIGVMLIASAGDASCTLSYGKTSYNDFIKIMNDTAKEVGAKNSTFTNPIGLDTTGEENLSTAQDLYEITKHAIKLPQVKKYVSQTTFSINNKDQTQTINVSNTNKLLSEIEGSVGVKTGTTPAAGEVLIYEYKKDKKDILMVIMGSTDRFEDTKRILNWVLSAYSWN